MPVMQGKIGNNQVQTLRDTGCNGVVVKKAHVNEDYNGKMGYILLINNTLRRAHMEPISVETPYSYWLSKHLYCLMQFMISSLEISKELGTLITLIQIGQPILL